MTGRIVLTLALTAVFAFAQDAPKAEAKANRSKAKPAKAAAEKLTESAFTRHEGTFGGQKMTYVATAGFLTLKSDSGEATAEVFHMSYEKWDAGVDLKRPVTFVFNGGPGSASLWLHMGGVGPRRVVMSEEGKPLRPPADIADNPDSWLAVSDLVFIDPVGTGYSRPAKGHKQSEFSGLEEDTRSVAAFIRAWVVKNRRWQAPKFLAGESYGTTRAASVASYLQDRYGMHLNGVVLVSMVLDFQTIRGGSQNDLTNALFLPTFAATAWYHKKLTGDKKELLAKAEKFALSNYLMSLAQGSALPDEYAKKTAAMYASLTGLSPEFVEQCNMRVSMGRFAKELLRDRRRTVGRLDSRFLGIDRDAGGSRYSYDPSMAAINGPFSAAFKHYVRTELKFECGRLYQTLGGVGRWKYPEGRFVNVADRLRSAMTKNRHLRVLLCSGYYDLATPYFAADYTMRHLGLDKSLQGNIRTRYYDAGHMMYIHEPSRKKLGQDITEFYRWALADPAPAKKQPVAAGSAPMK
ncbi:MAG: S10 family peptidase [Planctomycetota bacterium]|jgi:carboxypeptidase C (cathepsin A)